MQLCFKLSMPVANSWNGKWSGEDRMYAILKTFSGKKGCEHAREILGNRNYSYRFSDGWVACVGVMEVESPVCARNIRKKSVGFAGYDWMVDSICRFGEILDTNQVQERLKAQESPTKV